MITFEVCEPALNTLAIIAVGFGGRVTASPYWTACQRKIEKNSDCRR